MRIPSDEALRVHEEACKQNLHLYVDPDTRHSVFTSVGLLARERCCGKGCRHCPFNAQEQAIAKRKDVPCYPFRETLGTDAVPASLYAKVDED
jgi:hypothetical protein